jgi:hypothetical protein
MKTESRVRARPSSLLFPTTWVLSWDRGDRRSDEAINKKRTTALGTPGKGSCSHRRDGGEPVSRPRRRRPRVVHLRTATSFQETYCIKQEVEKLHPRRPRASRAPSSSQSPVRPSHVVSAFCGMVPVLRAITAQRTCSCILACVSGNCADENLNPTTLGLIWSRYVPGWGEMLNPNQFSAWHYTRSFSI